MPQLDALTYFSQYVYLLITFIAVHYFVLSFIIPKTLATLKIRQKLNSLSEIGTTNKSFTPKQAIAESSQLLTVTFNKYYSPAETLAALTLTEESSSTALLQYDNLLYNSWVAGTSHANVAGSTNQWLMSAVALQLSQNIRLRKLLCGQIVRKLGA